MAGWGNLVPGLSRALRNCPVARLESHSRKRNGDCIGERSIDLHGLKRGQAPKSAIAR